MTKLEVVNVALARIGEPCASAAALEAVDCKPGSVVAAFWDLCVLRVLAEKPWRFARRRVKRDAELVDGEVAVRLPADCLAVVGVSHFGRPVEWELVGNKVLVHGVGGRPWRAAAMEELTLELTARVADVSAWPAAVADCLAVLLAAQLAGNLTGNHALATSLLQEYEQVRLPKADVQESRRGSSEHGRRRLASGFGGSELLRRRAF